MEHAPKSEKNPPEAEGEVKIFEGKKYRKVDSGYTIREWYSHESPRKGPGPGWDFRWEALERHGADEPSELPDTPYYIWKPVEE